MFFAHNSVIFDNFYKAKLKTKLFWNSTTLHGIGQKWGSQLSCPYSAMGEVNCQINVQNFCQKFPP